MSAYGGSSVLRGGGGGGAQGRRWVAKTGQWEAEQAPSCWVITTQPRLLKGPPGRGGSPRRTRAPERHLDFEIVAVWQRGCRAVGPDKRGIETGQGWARRCCPNACAGAWRTSRTPVPPLLPQPRPTHPPISLDCVHERDGLRERQVRLQRVRHAPQLHRGGAPKQLPQAVVAAHRNRAAVAGLERERGGRQAAGKGDTS